MCTCSEFMYILYRDIVYVIVLVYSNVHMCVADLCTFYIGIWGAAVEAEKQSV